MKKEAGKAALADMLSRHDLTPLRAVVIRVDKGSRTVLLDIGGLGIKGVCRMIDWSDSPMTEVMMDTIKPGLEVMVKVTGRTSRIVKKDGQLDKVNTGAYKCVRRSYSDPYEGLSANFPVGTSVIAKLVKMEGNMCFMQIDGFDRLHILCFKPWLRDEGHENTSGVNKVIVGHVYTVEVTVCDEKMRKFRGRIVREHPTRTDKDLEGFMKYKEKVTEGAITASASSKED